jgi:hypothetical protein
MPDMKEIAAREKALKEEQSRAAQLGTKQLITIAQQLGSGYVLEYCSRCPVLISLQRSAHPGLCEENKGAGHKDGCTQVADVTRIAGGRGWELKA